MDRPWLTAIAAGLAAAAALFIVWPSSAGPPPLVDLDSGPVSTRSATVHVSGLVLHPGLIALEPGARVADAIVAAGGALPGADLGVLNLAAPIIDGQRLVVPDASETSGVASDGMLRVNTAAAGDLERLPGVGPVLAGRIVAFRTENGPFAVVEDLLDVPGIGEAKLASIRDLVIVP